MINARRWALAHLFAAVLGSATAIAQQTAGNRPTFMPDGTVHVPAFDLPPSGFLSPEALAFQRARSSMGAPPNLANPDIVAMRAAMEQRMAPQVAESQKRYPVDIQPGVMAGVKVQTITPRSGVANKGRILIDLHGGAFSMCAGACAMLESVPIAAVGRFKVVTIDYRQGPEHVFPAASEDVAAVYKDLLKTYKPENIGIYGCSAGGVLTGQVAAWLLDKGLPSPGVLGIFGSGATRLGIGDSAYVTAYIDGSFPAPRAPGVTTIQQTGYFKGADMDSALVSPAGHLDVMARFPPTILITGTRAADMSSAIYTHSQLLKAGARSQLLVGEGMGHCYIYSSNLPEARDAYDVIVRFFNEHLGARRARGATSN